MSSLLLPQKLLSCASRAGLLDYCVYFQIILVSSLLQEGGVTYERVLVLFFFCTDITVRALRDNLVNFFNDLVGWTLKFFSENLFDWVQRNGGWVSEILFSAFELKICLVFGFSYNLFISL